MIRWKLRKAVPFKVEDAHIDYQMFLRPPTAVPIYARRC